MNLTPFFLATTALMLLILGGSAWWILFYRPDPEPHTLGPEGTNTAGAAPSDNRLVGDDAPTYRGIVEGVTGMMPNAIKLGDPVAITYNLDSRAMDLDPRPESGIFRDNAATLRVTLPASDFDVGGTGQLQTFNNTESADDQISLYIPNILQHGKLQNYPVLTMGMQIIGDSVDASGAPNMLKDDDVPTQRLIVRSHVIFIETELGFTNFSFSVDGVPSTKVP